MIGILAEAIPSAVTGSYPVGASPGATPSAVTGSYPSAVHREAVGLDASAPIS